MRSYRDQELQLETDHRTKDSSRLRSGDAVHGRHWNRRVPEHGTLLEANGWVRHTFLVIGDAEDIRADLLELESASRGYVATGDESFLKSIEGLQARLAESRKLLRTLTADNPNQQRRLDVMDPLIDSRLADLNRISNIRAGKGLAAAVAAMQSQ